MKHIRVSGVIAREGPDAIWTEELVLVEHRRQHAPKLALAQDRREPPIRVAHLQRIVDEGPQFRMTLDEPEDAVPRVGILPDAP